MYTYPPARCIFVVAHDEKLALQTAAKLREVWMGASVRPGHTVHAGASAYTVVHLIPTREAARVTKATQVFVLQLTDANARIARPLRLGIPPLGDGLSVVHQHSLGDDVLTLLDDSLALVLLGAFQAYFHPGYNRRAGGGGGSSSNSSSGNLLLLSDAGAGTVECAVAAAHRVDATSVCVNLGVLVARGAESADRELRRALQVALATHPSVVVLEDAEALNDELDDASAAGLQAAIL
jgi:hypothetical protein